MVESHELLALVNLILCFSAVSMCLCRLNTMNTTVKLAVRAKYAVITAAALCSAFQPWWGEWPEWGSLAMSASLVFALLTSKSTWRNGLPVTAVRPLEE